MSKSIFLISQFYELLLVQEKEIR